MYNLGIFHVHGWGGVKADSDAAKALFEAAAKLGQVDARKALNLETQPNDLIDSQYLSQDSSLSSTRDHKKAKSSNSRSDSGISNSPLIDSRNKFFYETEPKSTDSTNLWFKVLNIKMDDFMSDDQKNSYGLTDDSGILDLSPQDEVDVFL